MPRLRQAVLVARDLDATSRELRARLGLAEPYHDPGVARFGLRNAVMALGDTFVEVVSPTRDDTAASRHLERRGGDGAYMVMFAVDDVVGARLRAAEAGVREVFAVELPDIVDVHLHPRDMGAAIVAIDEPRPASSWRWAGPAWTGRSAPAASGGLLGATVQAADPAAVAERWAHVLGADAGPSADGAAVVVALDDGELRFVEPEDERGDGIVAFHAAVAGRPDEERRDVALAGVRFTLDPAPREADPGGRA